MDKPTVSETVLGIVFEIDGLSFQCQIETLEETSIPDDSIVSLLFFSSLGESYSRTRKPAFQRPGINSF